MFVMALDIFTFLHKGTSHPSLCLWPTVVWCLYSSCPCLSRHGGINLPLMILTEAVDNRPLSTLPIVKFMQV